MALKICVVLTDGGGGHRASAQALQHELEGRGHAVDIVNIYKEWLRSPDEDVYSYICLKKGWTGLFWPVMVPIFRLKVWAMRSNWIKKVRGNLQGQNYDVVVSVIPYLNHILYRAWSELEPTKAFHVVLLTDIGEPAKDYWINHRLADSAHVITHVPSSQAEKWALNLGYDKERVLQHFGTPMRPAFTNMTSPASAGKRVVVSFGGLAQSLALEFAQQIAGWGYSVDLLTGRNEALLQRATGIDGITAHGFLDEQAIIDILDQAALLVGKAWPWHCFGSTCEACSCFSS